MYVITKNTYWQACLYFNSEPPEEKYDPRSLFDRLQEQKNTKDMEYEEAHKLSEFWFWRKAFIYNATNGKFPVYDSAPLALLAPQTNQKKPKVRTNPEYKPEVSTNPKY